jgi:hypothetical protein
MGVHRSSENHADPSVVPRVESPDISLVEQSSERLQVNVLYTTHSGTLAALKVASRLGANLGTRPKVLRLYAVPYALPLERPAVPIDFLEEELRALACESTTEFTARIYLCREPRWTLRELFPPPSVIVLAGRKRWWPTKEQRWARMLKKDGHEVIFADLR